MIHAAEFFFNIADYVAAPGFDWLNFNEASNTQHATKQHAAANRAKAVPIVSDDHCRPHSFADRAQPTAALR